MKSNINKLEGGMLMTNKTLILILLLLILFSNQSITANNKKESIDSIFHLKNNQLILINFNKMDDAQLNLLNYKTINDIVEKIPKNYISYYNIDFILKVMYIKNKEIDNLNISKFQDNIYYLKNNTQQDKSYADDNKKINTNATKNDFDDEPCRRT